MMSCVFPPHRYSSVRKLVKLESVQFILENHTVRAYSLNPSHWQLIVFFLSLFFFVFVFLIIITWVIP